MEVDVTSNHQRESGTSTSSMLSTAKISEFVESLRNQRNRSSTRENYYRVWKGFNKFFINLDQKPEFWEDKLTLFVGYLISKNRQSSTIKSYISAIKSVLLENRIKISEDKFLLSSLVRACRLKNDRVGQRFPIERPLLETLVREIKDKCKRLGQLYLSVLYQALFLSAYYGLLRIGETTSGTHPILAPDVQVATNKKKILFILRSSKTHARNKPHQLVKISSKPNTFKKLETDQRRKDPEIICPYRALRTYIKFRPTCKSPIEPFFVFRDRSPVTPSQFRKILRLTLMSAGFRPQLYCGHSFRIGQSVDLYKMGVPVQTIMKLGRWKSNSVYSYLLHV